MPQTDKQKLGEFGERLVAQRCICPKCKKEKTLKLLPANFKCADLICDFCGYLGQVKTKNVSDTSKIPNRILGAAWEPQKSRMDAGIYFSLFLVLVNSKNQKDHAIYYLASDLQQPDTFVARKKLSETAKRAGWQRYYYDLEKIKHKLVKLA